MKKHIVLVCEGGQQFVITVDELSVSKVIKSILDDLRNPDKQFICPTDYVPGSKESDIEMWVKSSIVNAVVTAEVNNSSIQVPNKRLFIPPGGKPN